MQENDFFPDQKQGERAETTVEGYSASIASENHHQSNEDACFFDQENRSAGVFDGVGSSNNAAYASHFAQAECQKMIAKLPKDLSPKKRLKEIQNILSYVHRLLHQQSQERSLKLNTTASVCQIVTAENGQNKLIIGNVGDSRIYLFRDGQLFQLTVDDNDFSQEIMEKFSNVNTIQELSEAEKKIFAERHMISQSLGQDYSSAHMNIYDVYPEDVILLCSDGISDNLTNEEIEAVAKKTSVMSMALILLDDARQRSHQQNEDGSKHLRAKKDDMTAVVMKLKDKEKKPHKEKEREPKKSVLQRLRKFLIGSSYVE